MALYHLHVKNISRRGGRSVVAAAAYRAGETLPNEAEERDSRFGGRRGVLAAEIHLPADAPAWMADRAALWNAVEARERRKDARLAKEVEFSLPRELPRDAWLDTARAMAAHFTAQGFVVDLALHDDGTGHNPHAHLMLATRAVTHAGFGPKLRAADRKDFLTATRTRWQAIANAALAKAGISVKITASSYAARGIEREPGQHRPPDPVARRQRRDEVAAMRTASDVQRAITEMAAEPDIKERFPLLSQQPDWPPQMKNAPGILPSAVRNEERRYWAEVHARTEGEMVMRPGQQRDSYNLEDRFDRDGSRGRDEFPDLDEAVKDLRAKRDAATLLDGEERRAAFVANATTYQRLYDEVSSRMVRAGILDRNTIRSWDSISAAYRDPGFDEMLSEARAIEAKRNERAPTLKASPEAIARVAELERREAEQTSIAFTPRRSTTPIHIEQQATPMPQPAMSPVRRSPGLEQAQTRMLQENLAERPGEPVVTMPSRSRESEPAQNPYGMRQAEPPREATLAETPIRDSGNSYGIKAELLTPKPPQPSDDREQPKLDRQRFWER